MPIRNRFQQRAAVQVARPVPAESTVAATMADVFSDFSDKATNRLAELVVNDERRAGLLAGAAGSPQLREDRTLAGEAFNAGAIAAYGARLRNQIAADTAKIATEVNSLPPSERLAAFDAKVAGLEAGMLEGLQEDLIPEATVQIQSQALRYRANIFDGVVAQETADNQAAASLDIETSIGGINTAMREGNLTYAMAQQETLEAGMDAYVASGLISEGERLVALDKQTKQAVQNWYLGEGDRARKAGFGTEYWLNFMDNSPAGMPVEERDAIVALGLSELTKAVRLENQIASDEAALDAARQEDASLRMELRILNAQAGNEPPLSDAELIAEAESGNLIPREVERFRRQTVKTGPQVTDKDVLLRLNANLDILSQADILAATDEVRPEEIIALINQHRNLPDFTSKPNYVAGLRAISGELGITDRMIIENTGDRDKARLTNRAKLDYFERIQGLENDRVREAEAINTANQVMADNFVGFYTTQLESARASLAKAKAEKDAASDQSVAAQERAQFRINKLETDVKDLEERVNKGTQSATRAKQ